MQRADMYTRVVLTVIALCLLWICARDIDIVSRAYAEDGHAASQIPMRVVVVGGQIGVAPLGGNSLPVTIYLPRGSDGKPIPLPVNATKETK
jgi:hypothetical protein